MSGRAIRASRPCSAPTSQSQICWKSRFCSAHHMFFDKTKSNVVKPAVTLAGVKSSAIVRVVTRRVAWLATHRKKPVWYGYERLAGSKYRSCTKMQKTIRSRPMKLATNKKARSSGFMTSKSMRRTATGPYLFFQGRRFMRIIPSACDESKEVAVQVAIGGPLGSIEYRKTRMFAYR